MKEYNPREEKLARWIQPTLLYLRLCDGAGWQAVPCFSRPSVDRPGRGLDYYTSRCTSSMHAQCRSDTTIMSYGVFYERSRKYWGFHFYSQWVLVQEDGRRRLLGAPIAFRSQCPCLLFRPSSLPFGHLRHQSCLVWLARIRSCVEMPCPLIIDEILHVHRAVHTFDLL